MNENNYVLVARVWVPRENAAQVHFDLNRAVKEEFQRHAPKREEARALERLDLLLLTQLTMAYTVGTGPDVTSFPSSWTPDYMLAGAEHGRRPPHHDLLRQLRQHGAAHGPDDPL